MAWEKEQKMANTHEYMPPIWEIQKLLTPDFSLAQPLPLQPSQEVKQWMENTSLSISASLQLLQKIDKSFQIWLRG